MSVKVYEITSSNAPGKRYFGVTKRTLRRRLYFHVYHALKGKNIRMSMAVRKYGADTFSIRELARFETMNEAFDEERRLIAAAGGPNSPDVWNMTEGGEGVVEMAQESRIKLSMAMRNRLKNPEYAEMMREKFLRACESGHEALTALRQRNDWRSWDSAQRRAGWTEERRKMQSKKAKRMMQAGGVSEQFLAMARASHEERAAMAARSHAARRARGRVYRAVSLDSPDEVLVLHGMAEVKAAGFSESSVSLASRGLYGGKKSETKHNRYRGYAWSVDQWEPLTPTQTRNRARQK